MVISENYCNFKVLKIKSLQKIIAMITEDKVTEIFCIADDFCKVFDAQMEKYTIKSNLKRKYHRESTMSKAEIMVIIILFHSSFLQRICMCASSTFVSQGCVIQSFCGTPEDHCYSFGNLYKEGAFGKMYRN